MFKNLAWASWVGLFVGLETPKQPPCCICELYCLLHFLFASICTFRPDGICGFLIPVFWPVGGFRGFGNLENHLFCRCFWLDLGPSGQNFLFRGPWVPTGCPSEIVVGTLSVLTPPGPDVGAPGCAGAANSFCMIR